MRLPTIRLARGLGLAAVGLTLAVAGALGADALARQSRDGELLAGTLALPWIADVGSQDASAAPLLAPDPSQAAAPSISPASDSRGSPDRPGSAENGLGPVAAFSQDAVATPPAAPDQDAGAGPELGDEPGEGADEPGEGADEPGDDHGLVDDDSGSELR